MYRPISLRFALFIALIVSWSGMTAHGQRVYSLNNQPVSQSLPQYVPTQPSVDFVAPPRADSRPLQPNRSIKPIVNRPDNGTIFTEPPSLSQPTAGFMANPSNSNRPVTGSLSRDFAQEATAQEIAPAPQESAQDSKPEKKVQHHYGVDYSIYRDMNSYPIDPRKPCNKCQQPCQSGQCLLGNGGRPYQEREPGGCQCGSKHPCKRPNVSVYWPRPLSAKQAMNPKGECRRRKLEAFVDRFDPLAKVKLVNYQRKDNGYCGPGSDPYGCLGESKIGQSTPVPTGVKGIGYQFPSEPNSPGFDYPADDPNLRVDNKAGRLMARDPGNWNWPDASIR